MWPFCGQRLTCLQWRMSGPHPHPMLVLSSEHPASGASCLGQVRVFQLRPLRQDVYLSGHSDQDSRSEVSPSIPEQGEQLLSLLLCRM